VAMSYQIDVDRKWIFQRVCGEIGKWDLGVDLQRLWADPQFNPEYARLVDATDVTGTTIRPGFFQAIAEDFRAKTFGKVALLATSESMYQLLEV
jgi:hypothetical protein